MQQQQNKGPNVFRNFCSRCGNPYWSFQKGNICATCFTDVQKQDLKKDVEEYARKQEKRF